MHRLLSYLFILLLLLPVAGAQQEPAGTHAPAKTAASPSLPSEETVNAFLKQMFGYDSSLSWKVVSIKPAEAEGLTEVNFVVTGPQGKQTNKFYVTSDGRHVISGDIIPFGPHPFLATQKE